MKYRVLFIVIMAFLTPMQLIASPDEMFAAAYKLHAEGKKQEAIATYEKVIAHKDASLYFKTQSLVRLSAVYEGMGDRQKAADTLERLIKVDQFDNSYTRGSREYYRYSRGKLLLNIHGKEKQGLELLQQILDGKDPDIFAGAQAFAHTTLAAWARGQKDYDLSYKHCEALIRDHTGHSQMRYIGVHLMPVITATQGLQTLNVDVKEFISLINRTMAIVTSKWPNILDDLQMIKVMILYERGYHTDALAETEILLDVSSNPKHLEQCVRYIAQVFKAMDGSLYRYNYYLEYQQFGPNGKDAKPNTADDVPDPFEGIELSNLEERDKAFEAGMNKLKRDWKSRLSRAQLYRYWGKPEKAVKELKIAFGQCPIEQKALQTVTDQIVEVLVQITDDPDIGKTFIAFQQFGPNGPDGTPDTDDDLINPLVTYSK